MTWQLVPHTADIAIEADGASEGDALAQAATALASVMTGLTDTASLESPEEMTFRVEAPDREALVVAFLSELLWLAESEDLLWCRGGVDVAETPDGMFVAEARANAAPLGDVMGQQGVEVKAITYHDLHSAQRGNAWHIRVLLDI